MALLKRSGLTALAKGLLCSSILLPVTAFAQVQESKGEAAAYGTFEEIMVTARRRDERLQDTPVAVTAFNSSAILEKSIFNVSEIGRLAPNLSISSGRGSRSVGFVFIRGIGQADDNPSVDPGVAQYVDDVYIGRAQGSLLNLNDVKSIEVLRGPQGTLYGKNTIGGAIKISSNLPGTEPEYSAAATYGNYDYLSLRGMVSQPLVEDRLFMRLSVERTRNDGFMLNTVNNEKTNNIDLSSGRLMLRFLPADNLDILFSLDGSRDRSKPAHGRLLATTPTQLFGLTEAFIGSVLPHVWQKGENVWQSPYDVQDDPALSHLDPMEDIWGASLRATWDFGDMTFKSISSYRSLERERLIDIDQSPHTIINAGDELDQWQISQEFQLGGDALDGRFNWLTGLFYFKEKVDFVTYGNFVPGLIPFGLNIGTIPDVQLSVESYAGFVNGIYDITDRLSANVGLRYTYEKKTMDTKSRRLNTGIVYFGPFSVADNFSDLSPKFGLDYKWTDDLFTYATISKGFKSGGFNGRAGGTAQLEFYEPETAWTYEAGVKSQWLDRRVTLNAAAFYTSYKDIQLQVMRAINGNLVQSVENAGKAHMQGLELEAVIVPLDGLSIFGNLGVIDAKYDEYFDDALGDVSFRKFVNTPEISFSVGSRYDIPVSDSMTAAIGVDYSYRSKVYYDPQNTESIAQSGYGLLNARASLYLLDDTLEIAVYGKNLANKTYVMNGVSFLDSFGFSEGFFGDPRTYGLTLNWQY